MPNFSVAERAGMSAPPKLARPLRILACIEARTVTGPAKNLLMIAQALAAHGPQPCDFRVVTFTRGEPANAFLSACAAAGVEVDIIRERRRFDPGVVPQLRAVIDRYRPDLIQSHNIKSHFLIRASGIHRQIPWIAFNHGYTAEDFKMRLYNQLDRWSLPAARKVVVVCEAFGEAMRRWGVPKERIEVRHNSVETFERAPAMEVERLKSELSIARDCVLLLSVGRLSREKGHSDLLRAAAQLKRMGETRFALVLVGAGPEFGRLQAQCSELGLAGQVVFAGHTGQVSPYYSMADIFVLPSHSEGSPNALLEAMSAGLPVVATKVGGVPEIIQSGVNGLMLPARDPGALAQAMATLLRHPELRAKLGAAAAASAAASYSRQSHIDWMLRFYTRTLGIQLSTSEAAVSQT